MRPEAPAAGTGTISWTAGRGRARSSGLHITKPEIDFNPIAGEHEQRTYDKAVENFKLWKQKGWLVQDEKEKYYVYAQTMGDRTQYGLVLWLRCAAG